MRPTATTGPAASLADLLDRVPEGWTLVSYDGRPYGVSRTMHAGGKSISILARELGGTDLVSANVYATSRGHQLHACEMPDQKVLDFLEGWQPRPVRSDRTADPSASRPGP